MVLLDDLEGSFQSWWFCDTVLWTIVGIFQEKSQEFISNFGGTSSIPGFTCTFHHSLLEAPGFVRNKGDPAFFFKSFCGPISLLNVMHNFDARILLHFHFHRWSFVRLYSHITFCCKVLGLYEWLYGNEFITSYKRTWIYQSDFSSGAGALMSWRIIRQTRLEGTSKDHPVQNFLRKKRGCGSWQIWKRDKFVGTSLLSPIIKIVKRDPNVPCCCTDKQRQRTCASGREFPTEYKEKSICRRVMRKIHHYICKSAGQASINLLYLWINHWFE